MTLRTKITKLFPHTLAVGFLFFGAQKFGAENAVFEIIAERSGLEFFEPYIRRLTGIAELATAALFLVPLTGARKMASISAAGVLAGAIGFHLSPWLGINVPGIGHGLFVTAVILFALNAALLISYLSTPRQPNPPLLAS